MEIVQEWGLNVGDRVAYFHGHRCWYIAIGVVVHITPSGMVDIDVDGEKIRFNKEGEEVNKSDYIRRPFIKPLTPELELKALQQKAANVMAEFVRKGVTLDKDRIEKLLELLEE